MKIISWNVNGLRAVHKKGNLADVFALNPDILLLQETKSEVEQLPEEVRAPKGYCAYFNSSKGRKGYSGVALYSKVEPLEVRYDLGNGDKLHLDTEGRLICAEYDTFVLYNVYFPNGGGGPERLAYKLEYYDEFLEHIEKVRIKGKAIIFGGDVNTAHEEIDLARPKENEKNTGFLPEERAWLDAVTASGYVDTYRHFFPNKAGAYTYWDMKTAARERNVGWRIDYLFVSPELTPKLKSAAIHSDVLGSDHCPLSITIA